MKLKHTATLLFLIAQTSYVFSGDAFTPSPGNKEPDYQRFSIGYDYYTPLQLEGSNELSISSNSANSLFKYESKNRQGTSFSIQLNQRKHAFEIEDSSHTALSIANCDRTGLSVHVKQDFMRNEFGITLGASEATGLDKIQLTYSHRRQHYELFAKWLMQRQNWTASIEDQLNTTPVKVFYESSIFTIGNTIQTSWGSLTADIDRSVPVSINTTSEGLGIDLSPVSVAYHLRLNKPLRNDDRIEIFLNSLSDTLNTDIRHGEDLAGKLFALDRDNLNLGFFFGNEKTGFSLSYHNITTRLSGYVIAGYFSDILSQLSGARYYHQVEAQGSYYDLAVEHTGKPGSAIKYRIENSIIRGSGELYSKHYVFQLFNPLADIGIQEVKIHSIILNKLHLDVAVEIVSNVTLLANIDYILPLYLDLETSPETDYDSAEITLGSRVGIQMIYNFD